jgi:hypothetical protein
MKYISYAIFGYGKQEENCFDFYSYLRGLWINIRLARCIYPDWNIHVSIDENSYNQFEKLFNNWKQYKVRFKVLSAEPLCKAMLWRLLPIFEPNVERIICRDTDSPLTYREAQMVKEWENTPKVLHAITDSVSHNIPLMGGMIGLTKHFRDRFQNLDNILDNRDYSLKGTDQDTLNAKLYPIYAAHGTESIIQHYILGMPNTFLSGYRNSFIDEPLENVNEVYRQTNDTCGHIGAAGWYEAPMLKFLNRYDEFKEDYKNLEKEYKHIFYWANE